MWMRSGQAVAVLKRHGEPLGISGEVLERIVKLPEEQYHRSGPGS
jgi:hypothetical protein